MNNLLTKLIDELKKHNSIKIVSFDIFDTVLFRMVKKPTDVFEIAAEKAIKKGVLSYYMTPVIYKNIRREAEKQARKQKKDISGHIEVNLKDIMECLPDYIGDCKEQMIEFELRAEEELCYINPDIQEVIDYLVQKKKYKIIFISDMYLSSKEIGSILIKNKFSTKIIDKFYISGEIGKNKTTGTMYDYVLDDLRINAEDIIHIGDNVISDVVNAESIGINTIYYDVISKNCTEIQMEQIKYGTLMPELYSLRKFVSEKAEYLDKEKQQWFRTGAMVLGPLMSGMAEWVLDTAKKEGISNIYPLMREGMLITKLLTQAAGYREENYHIEPMYISRKSVCIPSIIKFDELEYERLTMSLKRNGEVKNLLELLEIKAEDSISDLIEVTIAELRKDKIKEKRLKEYIFSEEVQKQMEQSIREKRKSIRGYLDQLGINQRFITVDVGFNGTIQEGLEKTIFAEKTKYERNIHLVMFGTYKCMEKIFDNIDIRGYVGCCGENDDIVSEVAQRPYLLEQFMMCECGTTMYYLEKDGEYVPALEKITKIGQQQYEKISYIQEGILQFQKYYLDLKKKKHNIIKRSADSVRESAKIFTRLQTMPALKEAKAFGKLLYDENYGVNSIIEFSDEESITEVKNMGAEKWLKNIVPGQKPWVESIVVQAQQEYYVDKALAEMTSDYEKSILGIVKKVFINRPKSVIIAGAGEAGRMLQKYLELYGMQIEAFTDSNTKLQGNFVDNIPVKSLKDDFESSHFVIASFAFAEEIENQIREIKGNGVTIYSINI